MSKTMRFHRWDFDVLTSLASTNGGKEMRTKLGVYLIAKNVAKEDRILHFWASLCIGCIGRFIFDVRELPNTTEADHSAYAHVHLPHFKRAASLELVAQAFDSKEALVSWCKEHAQQVTSWEEPRWQLVDGERVMFGQRRAKPEESPCF